MSRVDPTGANKIQATQQHKGQIMPNATREEEMKELLIKQFEKAAALFEQKSAEGTVHETIERGKHRYKREAVPTGVVKESQDPATQELRRKLEQADEKVEQVREAIPKIKID